MINSKKLLTLFLALILVAPVLVSHSAVTNAKNIHVKVLKKNIKKSKKKTKNTKTIFKSKANQQKVNVTANQLNDDIKFYNNQVGSEFSSDIIPGSNNDNYVVASPRYSLSYSGIGSSLNNIATDMGTNVDASDLVSSNDDVMMSSSNMKAIENVANSIYLRFANRLKSKLSHSDFDKLTTIKATFVSGSQKVSQGSDGSQTNEDPDVVNQWSNIRQLFSALGDGISQLDK